MKFKNFVGGSYYLENIQYDSCRSVNLYPEIDENNTGMDMEFAQLRTPPGKTLLTTLPTGDSIRGLYTTTKGDTYAVAGSIVYELTGSLDSTIYTQIGILSSDIGPVSICDNNNVVIFIDKPNGYYYAPGVITSTILSNGGVGYSIGDILTLENIR